QTRYISTGAIVGFAMNDAVSVIIDGVEARQPSLLLVKGEGACEMVEPQANLVAFVKFDAIDGRGWPGEAGRAQLLPTQPAELAALRSVTRDILLLASNSPDLLLQPQVIGQLEESLLHAVDQALQRSSPLGDGGRVDLSDYLRLVRKLDEFLQQNAAKVP